MGNEPQRHKTTYQNIPKPIRMFCGDDSCSAQALNDNPPALEDKKWLFELILRPFPIDLSRHYQDHIPSCRYHQVTGTLIPPVNTIGYYWLIEMTHCACGDNELLPGDIYTTPKILHISCSAPCGLIYCTTPQHQPRCTFSVFSSRATTLSGPSFIFASKSGQFTSTVGCSSSNGSVVLCYNPFVELIIPSAGGNGLLLNSVYFQTITTITFNSAIIPVGGCLSSNVNASIQVCGNVGDTYVSFYVPVDTMGTNEPFLSITLFTTMSATTSPSITYTIQSRILFRDTTSLSWTSSFGVVSPLYSISSLNIPLSERETVSGPSFPITVSGSITLMPGTFNTSILTVPLLIDSIPVVTSQTSNRANVTSTSWDWGSINGTADDLPAYNATLLVHIRSLAIQKYVSKSNTRPYQVNNFTLNFQISDYFTFNSLVIVDTLNDGHNVTDGITPVMVLFGRSYDMNDFTSIIPTAYGSSVIVFNVSSLLRSINATSNGVAYGPWTAFIRYSARTSAYYVANLSPVKQGDRIWSSVLFTANLGQTGGSVVTDTSSTSIVVSSGPLSAIVYAINDLPPNPNYDVVAGDMVTYEIQYVLPISTFGGITIQAFFPPVIEGVDQLVWNWTDANGSPDIYYANTVSSANTTGSVASFWDTTGAPRLKVQAVADIKSNSIKFTFSAYNDPLFPTSVLVLRVSLVVSGTQRKEDIIYSVTLVNAFEGAAKYTANCHVVYREPSVSFLAQFAVWTDSPLHTPNSEPALTSMTFSGNATCPGYTGQLSTSWTPVLYSVVLSLGRMINLTYPSILINNLAKEGQVIQISCTFSWASGITLEAAKNSTGNVYSVTVNSKPRPENLTFFVNEGSNQTVNLHEHITGRDGYQDIDWKTLSLTSSTLSGSVNLTNGSVYYQPKQYFWGNDSVSYKICDSTGACKEANITYVVAYRPHAPFALNQTLITPQNGVSVNISSRLFCPDSPLSFVRVDSVTSGSFAMNTSQSYPASSPYLLDAMYTPPPFKSGSFIVILTACNEQSMCSPLQFNFTVVAPMPPKWLNATAYDNSTNQEVFPTIYIDSTQNIGTKLQQMYDLYVALNISDIDRDSAKISRTPSYGTAHVNDVYTNSDNETILVIRYIPTTSTATNDTIRYAACDMWYQCAESSIQITFPVGGEPGYCYGGIILTFFGLVLGFTGFTFYSASRAWHLIDFMQLMVLSSQVNVNYPTFYMNFIGCFSWLNLSASVPWQISTALKQFIFTFESEERRAGHRTLQSVDQFISQAVADVPGERYLTGTLFWTLVICLVPAFLSLFFYVMQKLSVTYGPACEKLKRICQTITWRICLFAYLGVVFACLHQLVMQGRVGTDGSTSMTIATIVACLVLLVATPGLPIIYILAVRHRWDKMKQPIDLPASAVVKERDFKLIYRPDSIGFSDLSPREVTQETTRAPIENEDDRYTYDTRVLGCTAGLYKPWQAKDTLIHRYFYLIVFAKKFLLALVIALFASNPSHASTYVQIIALLIILVAYIAIILWQRPYADYFSMVIDLLLSVVVVLVLIFSALMVDENTLSSRNRTRLCVAMIWIHYGTMVLFYIVCIPAFIKSMFDRKEKEKKREQQQQDLTQIGLENSGINEEGLPAYRDIRSGLYTPTMMLEVVTPPASPKVDRSPSQNRI
ncbi:adhesin-like protein [Planoprotostelium fungivorum]|uniref:Adhesin-like protein n=1 Tax=Planoprotostelium fungivorum TaxID=1890364 RepID=A0A2P6NJQ7_9EUKA|nr:adhesin-like protein [Planoprotostelium fungivorum]